MEPASSSKFEELFIQQYRGLCRIAFNLTGDLDAAKDIVQEVFFKLWRRRDKVTFDTAIGNYLRQATTHASYNYIKQKKTRHRILTEIDPLKNSSLAESVHSISFSELEKSALDAIDKLPPKCRTIFLLSRREEMKYQEIADHLGISVKTVEHQMGIALSKLRDQLRPFLTKEFLVPALIALLVYLATKIFR
ncbi:MAG TPA: RNA polymerase sigma-70 factor [Cyclobacteriaceae bacterium]|nr:RNA polymerase sigma-70 factor [Cyclobacteriaceae bacterium]